MIVRVHQHLMLAPPCRQSLNLLKITNKITNVLPCQQWGHVQQWEVGSTCLLAPSPEFTLAPEEPSSSLPQISCHWPLISTRVVKVQLESLRWCPILEQECWECLDTKEPIQSCVYCTHKARQYLRTQRSKSFKSWRSYLVFRNQKYDCHGWCYCRQYNSKDEGTLSNDKGGQLTLSPGHTSD